MIDDNVLEVAEKHSKDIEVHLKSGVNKLSPVVLEVSLKNASESLKALSNALSPLSRQVTKGLSNALSSLSGKVKKGGK